MSNKLTLKYLLATPGVQVDLSLVGYDRTKKFGERKQLNENSFTDMLQTLGYKNELIKAMLCSEMQC